MTDRIYLHGMVFEGRHGVTDEERETPQSIEVDLDVELDLRPAGTSDDLSQSVDYAEIFEACRTVVERESYLLLEAIAEALASRVLDGFPAVRGVTADVKKPGVPLDGVIEHAGVCIVRRR